MTTAVVLAGGLGTRLRSAVADVPKPMAPVNGRPFLEYLLDHWIDRGITQFILSVGYMGHVVSNYFGAEYRSIPIAYSHESVPLGTGGALIYALTFVNDNSPVLVINGDTFLDDELDRMLMFFKSRQADWCLFIHKNEDHKRYMALGLTEDGGVCSFNSVTTKSSGFINAGVYMVKPSSLKNLNINRTKISLEDEILPNALSNNQRIFALPSEGRFLDIGIPDDYKRALHVLNNNGKK